MERITEAWVKQHVHHRNEQGHKKDFGHVLVVAGSEGKAGAAILCAKAAIHAGCGLVTVMIPQEAVLVLLQEQPELMYIHQDAFDSIDLNQFDAIAIGPGLGFSEQAKNNLYKLMTMYHGPLVIDADALTMIATEQFTLQSNHIITPHPGEFARLFKIVYDAQNRLAQAISFVQHFPAILVLKGAGTIVASLKDGQLQNTTGNDGMATAGTGDVLTGIIVALCAQSYTPFNAAALGVFIHGLSGDLAIKAISKTSLVASDLIQNLSKIRILD